MLDYPKNIHNIMQLNDRVTCGYYIQLHCAIIQKEQTRKQKRIQHISLIIQLKLIILRETHIT